MMKKTILTLVTACICLSANAQNIITEFTGALKGVCSSFGYSYTMSGSVPVSGSGTVMFQNESFVMKGNGLEIYCDGKTRWTNDVIAEECYIETVDAQSLDFEANPALLIGAVDKAFSLKKTASGSFKGTKATEASLVPNTKNSNIKSVSLFFSSDKKPVGAILALSDGSSLTIEIKDFSKSQTRPEKEFTLDTKKLDKNYIITDLR